MQNLVPEVSQPIVAFKQQRHWIAKQHLLKNPWDYTGWVPMCTFLKPASHITLCLTFLLRQMPPNPHCYLQGWGGGGLLAPPGTEDDFSDSISSGMSYFFATFSVESCAPEDMWIVSSKSFIMAVPDDTQSHHAPCCLPHFLPFGSVLPSLFLVVRWVSFS